MENQRIKEAIKLAPFGRRKVRPRVYAADGKQHMRKFLREALEELSFIICGYAQVDELSVALDPRRPNLGCVRLSAGGIEAAALRSALSVRTTFDGKVPARPP